jgi:hypothetical protein
MNNEDRFVVRRSPYMLAFQFAAALFFIGFGIYAIVWQQPPLEPGQMPYAWLAIAAGVIALIVAWRRALQPAQMLVIDRDGLSWWKANRTIRWAEIERISLDTYRSTFYLHVKLATASGDVDTAGPHPIELFGSLITGSDLSFRLTGSDARRDSVRDALERVMPETVTLQPDPW